MLIVVIVIIIVISIIVIIIVVIISERCVLSVFVMLIRYWKSAAEKRGDSPWKDPLAIIGIVSIFLPFLILLIAIATGLVDVNGGR